MTFEKDFSLKSLGGLSSFFFVVDLFKNQYLCNHKWSNCDDFKGQKSKTFTLTRGHREGGPTGFSKNQKRHFLRNIEKPFHEVTPIGPQPHQFFPF